MRVGLLRAVGAVTAVYGVVVSVWPDLLARPSGLVDERGRTAWDTRVSLRPLAWRDTANGIAMALAPQGAALRTATSVRIASDLGDAVLLGATLPERDKRLKAVAVSVSWAGLSVAGLLGGDRGDAERGRRGCGRG